MNDDRNSVNAEQSNKWQTTRLKYRKYDEALIKKAKTMLVYGVSPGKVALLCRLDPAYVDQLFLTWNPTFRRICKPNQFTTQRMAKQLFSDGANLESICKLLDIPIFTLSEYLITAGVSRVDVMARMPEPTHKLAVEYRKTIARKQRAKHKAFSLH
ncbi:hypothetical protein RHD99_07780 [Buttiauxella selenatireducens]|uniref:Uncharacterized protein n=1 Tax=Buttiauxella selenatireducens TaxID=3073902 RepID=A0ABY9SE90_9ENTR|nr:hypothetical protein [Buttiauxella sp. R73]WMY75829.1 hypothetical protein RHD99_07780 [Buttiauxella sp. R73]